jgi:hypothetical protein
VSFANIYMRSGKSSPVTQQIRSLLSRDNGPAHTRRDAAQARMPRSVAAQRTP